MKTDETKERISWIGEHYTKAPGSRPRPCNHYFLTSDVIRAWQKRRGYLDDGINYTKFRRGFFTEEELLAAVKQNPLAIKDVKNPSEAVKRAAGAFYNLTEKLKINQQKC